MRRLLLVVLLTVFLIPVSAWPAEPPEARWRAVPLEHIGFDDGTRRYATDETLSLSFHTRGDQVVTGLRVRLELEAAALEETGVTGLVVRVNHEEVARYDRAAMGETPSLLIPVDSHLVVDDNLLTFTLLQEDGAVCPGRVPRGAFGVIAGGGVEMLSTPLPLGDDLGLLPLPLFDHRTDRDATIPVAILAPPTPAVIEAAAIVGARFGLHVGSQVRFSVTLFELPPSDALVLVTREAAPTWLPPDQGPALRMMDHPSPPKGARFKLVVLEAPDAESLIGVARAFALNEAPLRGPLHRVTEPSVPPETPPYHAPRWARPGAPMRLGDVAEPAALSHVGPGAGTLEVRFRIPPDLFPWPREVIPLELTYGQVTPPGQPAPRLAAELNGQWLGTLPATGPDGLRTEQLLVRRELLRGYNELYLHVDPSAGESCGPSDDEAARTFIDGGSALHIEDTPLFAPMPDIGKLVDDGFPYTRRADLGETVLVLPDPPGPEDIAAALSMTAHFAAVTGQVGARVRAMTPGEVARADGLDADLLIVGAAGLQPLLGRWASELPIDGTVPGRLTVRSLSPWELADAVMRGRSPIDEVARAEAALARPGTSAVLVQVESPLHRERSAVFVTAPVRRELPALGDLLGHADSRYPDSDLLVRGDSRLTMHRLRAGWHTGALEGWHEARWAFASRFVVLVPCSILGALLLAFAMGRSMRARELRRLTLPETGGDA